jgi:hypothetical protein
MRDYTELPDVEIAEMLLEESYVLHVEATPGQLALSILFALTDKHPAYEPPGPDSYLCYRRGVMVFSGVTRLVWADQGIPPSHDATGELDYGNVDSMTWDDDTYRLEGSVGMLEVVARSVAVALVPETVG